MSRDSLLNAALKPNVLTFKLLQDQGVDVNTLCSLRWIPLHYVILYPHRYAIELLSKYEANVNALDHLYETPVHYSVLENVRILLEHGANVNAVDYYGRTPLREAVLKPHSNIIKLLLEHGANIHPFDEFNETPSPPSVVEYYSKVIIRALCSLHSCSLHDVVDLSNEDIVKLILDYKVHENDLHKNDKTRLLEPLVYIVKFLLEHGSNVNVPDFYHRTPLHCFVLTPHADVVKLLIKHGADLNAFDNSHQTALHHAVLKPHVDMVKLLLEHGANVNPLDEACLTPLHHAILKSHADIVELLLNHGANVNASDSSCRTPLHYFFIANKPDISILYTLVKYGASVNAVDQCGMHVLSAAVRYPTTPYYIVKLFLENGAIPDFTNKTNILNDISFLEDYCLVKLLIQYIILRIFLSHEISEILDQFKCVLLGHFAEESDSYKLFLKIAHSCIIEIKNMRNDYISQQTLFQFVVQNCLRTTTYDQKVALYDIDELFLVLKSGKYVECRDLICAALECSIVVDKLCELEICYQTAESVTLSLNYDCIGYLTKYMSKDDVINLCIVFFNEFIIRQCSSRGNS